MNQDCMCHLEAELRSALDVGEERDQDRARMYSLETELRGALSANRVRMRRLETELRSALDASERSEGVFPELMAERACADHWEAEFRNACQELTQLHAQLEDRSEDPTAELVSGDGAVHDGRRIQELHDSMPVLEQRLRDVLMDVDAERHHSSEVRQAADGLREENVTLSHICEVRAEELRDASTRHTASEMEQWEQAGGLRHEVGQLRALLGNHESQLSQSQELAQQLRRDALGHSEVRHVVAAELATEGVHAGRLEHRLHEELVEAARYRSDWSTLQGELAMIRNEHGDLKSELRQSAEVAADYASVDAQRRRQLEGLGAELAEAEQEFQRELAVLRGRLSSADLRNQRLCENLRQAVQVASTQAEPGQKPASPAPPPGADPAAAVAKMAENMNVSQMSAAGPASPELLAPSFTSDSGSTRSDD